MTRANGSKLGMKVYVWVYIALMLLLALTYGAAKLKLGSWNTPVSLLIALIKAILVVLYFMHIRIERGMVRIACFAGALWLGILLFLSMSDYITRKDLVLPSPWPKGPGSSDFLHTNSK